VTWPERVINTVVDREPEQLGLREDETQDPLFKLLLRCLFGLFLFGLADRVV